VPGDSVGTVVMKDVKVQSVDKRLQVIFGHIDVTACCSETVVVHLSLMVSSLWMCNL